MLDLKQIRDDSRAVEERLQRRDPSLSLQPVLAADERRRELLAEEERLRARQNSVGPEIATAKQAGGDAATLIGEMSGIKRRIQALAEERREADEALERLLLELPNLPHPSVPASADKRDNQVIRERGEKPSFDFAPRHHVELATNLGLVDFERGVKVAGAGWRCYRGLGARLEWALLQYCFDRGLRDGYEPVFPPLAVNAEIMTMAGVLPKFQDQVYWAERDDLYFIPTAEIVLTGLYRDEILPAEALPLKLMASTPCFRREAGSYGVEERGLIRSHQFNKLERYVICEPGESYDHLEMLTGQVEGLMAELELPYVTTLLVTGDIAQQAAKTYDIEVWLPGQGAYSEVSSVSNCEAYQARRGRLRYRSAAEGGAKPELVHTLNGSALATSRLFTAILENHQVRDGSVVVPTALRPYLGGLERLEPA